MKKTSINDLLAAYSAIKCEIIGGFKNGEYEREVIKINEWISNIWS